MDKSTEGILDRIIRFEDTTNGMAAGFWHYPLGGFRWVDGCTPMTSFVSESDSDDPGPWLVAAGQPGRRYPLLRRPGLLEAMDRLAEDPSKERILTFANRWGSLGEDQLLAFPAECEIDGAVKRGIGSGESLLAWRQHLLLYGDLRRLWRTVSVLTDPDSWSAANVRQAKKHVDSAFAWRRGGGCRYDSRFEAGDAWAEWHEWIWLPEHDESDSLKRHLANENSLEAARYYVHRKVNSQLRGRVNPSVLPFLSGAIRLFPDSLAAGVWLRFAFELAGGTGKHRECEHCRMPFAVGRRDQRFCGKNCQEAAAYRRRMVAASVVAAADDVGG